MKLITTRKTDELGRIVLPAEIRTKLCAETGTLLNIYEDGDRVIIERSRPYCKLCRSTENINNEINLCEDCISRVKSI